VFPPPPVGPLGPSCRAWASGMAAAVASVSTGGMSGFAPGPRGPSAPAALSSSGAAAAVAASAGDLALSSAHTVGGAVVPNVLCYGSRIGIRSCQQQRYVAAFPQGDGFDLDVSGFHPFRQGDVADRASDCPSEWLLLHYESRQHRGPVRLGDEVCFAKELTVAPGEKRKERYAYLALGPTAEGSSVEPVVDRKEGADWSRWTLVHADDVTTSGPLQCGMPMLIRGKYNDCLSVGKPLVAMGGPGGTVGFTAPSRLSGCRLACRGRDGRLPELRFRLVKAGMPFGVESRLSQLQPAPYAGLKSDPSADLGSMALREQELALLEDVLFCMLGADGVYLRRVVTPSSSSSSAPASAAAAGRGAAGSSGSTLPEVRFEIQAPPGADPSLLQFLKQALPLCEDHATVLHFATVQGQYEFGTVNHALCSAIKELLKEFSVKVGQLETALRSGNLTIAKMWYHIQPSMDTFALLARVASGVFGCIGGSVLNGIEGVMARSSLTAAQELCEYLLQQASRPYFQMVSKWIYEGQLDDPYGEFFVSQSSRVRDERFGGPAADFWQRHFALEERAVPQFMVASREKILHAGKYLHVFFSASPNAELPEPSERALFRYSRRRRDYVEAIEAAYRRASSALVGLFMRPAPDGLDLPGRLRSIRSFFFMGKGDWITQLMDTATAELEMPAAEVPLSRLEGLLDLAIRTSSAGSDAYRDDISCGMHSFRIEDACHRMTKGHALPIEDAEDDAASVKSSATSLLVAGRASALSSETAPAAAGGLSSRGPPAASSAMAAAVGNAAGDGSGIRCFTLKYRTSWPLSIVFSRSMLLKYQVIFRHLLYCRYVERKLVEVWVDHQYTKELDQVRTSFSPSYSLRQRMLAFCRDYIYYVTIEVLEPQSHAFLASLAQADSIDEVLRSHERFLDTCLREVLLTERDTLYRNLSKVLTTCLTFARNLHRCAHDLHDPQEPGGDAHARDFAETRMERAQQKSTAYLSLLSQKHYSKTIAKFKVIFESQLQGFLRQIQQESSTRYEHFLSNLATRLDYNEYYSSMAASETAPGTVPPSAAASQQPSRASSPGRGS